MPEPRRPLTGLLPAIARRRCRARRSTLAVLSVLALSPGLALASAVAWWASRTARHAGPPPDGPRPIGERGQATAEYALVLLGVAAIALLLAAWAARSGKIGQLFDAVIDQLIGKAR